MNARPANDAVILLIRALPGRYSALPLTSISISHAQSYPYQQSSRPIRSMSRACELHVLNSDFEFCTAHWLMLLQLDAKLIVEFWASGDGQCVRGY